MDKDNDEELDPVDEMIKKTGCMDFHIKVQVLTMLKPSLRLRVYFLAVTAVSISFRFV